jgi:hypothetical protein
MKRNRFAAGDKRKKISPQIGMEIGADVSRILFQNGDSVNSESEKNTTVRLEKSELRSDGLWWMVTIVNDTMGYLWIKESNLHL